MVERVTQRANFTNLNPQARPVDTFRRPDSRKLDEFVDWWDSRLKATNNLISSMGSAVITARQSELEEVRLKARADAVKNFYDPKRLEKIEGVDKPVETGIHLDKDSSYATYDKEVENTQDALKGIEAGKKLLSDEQLLNSVFLINKSRKKKIIKGQENEDYDPDTTEEKVFQELKEKRYANLPEDSGAFFLEKYNEAWVAFEDKFFDRLQKRNVGERVDTLSTLTKTWIDSGDLEFTVPIGPEIKPEEYDEYFYGKLGVLLDKGMEMGLERTHAQAVIIQELLLYAESFSKKTKDQEAGEITEE